MSSGAFYFLIFLTVSITLLTDGVVTQTPKRFLLGLFSLIAVCAFFKLGTS